MVGETRELWRGFGLIWRDGPAGAGACPGAGGGATPPDISPVMCEPGAEHWLPDGEGVAYVAPSVARFACRADGVTITPVVGADPLMIGRLLIANALPALLWLRGAYALHAAAVVMPGQVGALAVCGASGSGKSTLARQLIAQGAALVADDVLALNLSEDAVIGADLPGGLWSPVGEARTFAPVPLAQQRERAELSAILLLARGAVDSVAYFERARPVAAVELLLGQRHRPHIPALIDTRRAVLAQAARLAARVPLWRWTRPNGATALTGEEWSMLAEISR